MFKYLSCSGTPPFPYILKSTKSQTKPMSPNVVLTHRRRQLLSVMFFIT